MKTFMARPSNIVKRWWLVDADGRVLGRMATRLALILQGKHRPTYTPHLDTGDHVVVVNAAKLRLTGKKIEQKSHQYYTGYPSGQREIPYSELMVTDPARVIRLAVKRMLPKTTLGRHMLRKLRVYAGPEHPHVAQQPEALDI
jgi:large subunit ribosomal protein L13